MIPSRSFHFVGGLHAPAQRIDKDVLQAHVIKHPVGMAALMTQARVGGTRLWNAEGWDLLRPQVITLGRRRELTVAIQALEFEGTTCAYPRLQKESYGGEVPPDWERCYRCSPRLVVACTATTTDVATAYASVVDETLALVAEPDGKVVERTALVKRLVRREPAPDLTGLAILTVGGAPDPARPVARVNRWDGVRIELYLRGLTLSWRTTYRRLHRSPTTFLLDGATDSSDHRLPLSGVCIVPRPWWERPVGAMP